MLQHRFRFNWALAIAVLGIVSVLAGPATADIIVESGVNNQGTDNVNLIQEANAPDVAGTVGNTSVLAEFVSSSGTGLLSADPSGQATVSGGTGNSPFTNLEFSLDGGETFTRAVFNINAATDGQTTIHVEGINISGGVFEQDVTVDANGQNFFTVTAINGQLMTLIDLTAFDGATFQDVRQVRIGLGESTSVPEPTTLMLLGSGLVAVGMLGRRLRK